MLKFLSFVIFCIHMLCSTPCFTYNSHYHNFDNQEVIKTGAKMAFATGVAVTCAYAVYKVGEWLFRKTDEQIYQEACVDALSLEKYYTTLIVFFKGCKYKAIDLEKTFVQYPLNNIQKDITTLKTHYANLYQRLKPFTQETQDISRLHQDMRTLASKITTILACLEFCNACESYRHIKTTYQKLLTVWENKTDFASLEDLLERFSINAHGLQSLNRNISTLEYCYKNIYSYYQTLHKEVHESVLKNNITILLDNVTLLVDALYALYDFLASHKAYFDLNETFEKTKQKYSKELKALKKFRNDEASLHKQLASLVMSTFSKKKYPYITYMEQLKDAIATTQSSLNQCDHAYCNQEKIVHELLDSLESLYSIIIIHPSFHNELQHREQHRLEEERIRIEKQRLSVERQKLDELHNQTLEFKKHNWLKDKNNTYGCYYY